MAVVGVEPDRIWIGVWIKICHYKLVIYQATWRAKYTSWYSQFMVGGMNEWAAISSSCPELQRG